MSYYSDASIVRLLRLDQPGLVRARQELINTRLIAYQSPLYQVLALDPSAPQSEQPRAIQRDPGHEPAPTERRQRLSQPVMIGQILQQMMERAQ